MKHPTAGNKKCLRNAIPLPFFLILLRYFLVQIKSSGRNCDVKAASCANFSAYSRAGIFERVWGPGMDSKE
jgi:hypothetical protein